jgi:hypothetical protein
MTRVAIVLVLLLGVARAADTVHHDLVVRLEPAAHAIAILDKITGASGNQRFRLHAGLTVTPTDEAFTVELLRTVDGPVPLKEYGLRGPVGKPAFLRLAGKIPHPLVEEEQEYARSFSRTPGIISDEGVVLSGGTYWIPHFEDRLLTFSLKVELPADWDAVSQGKRTHHEKGRVTWECKHPMEEVYLIAARFTEYSRPAANATAYAFLRTPDASLASKYLETTAQYLEMYRGLIGPYPFEKFALVENFWETGYGMPSFTLLGPRIIRFPFILHSSYPHEILHNWWGNSVYVDWKTGNWCEGLTAYLADHLIKEGQGLGVAYRRDTLKKYRNYVRGEKDFPLKEFRSRHSSATEAVGYGKSAMLFHMLRWRLGDAEFARGLQRFYRDFKFKQASFADLGRVFGAEAFVREWVERPGAPVLAAAVEEGELVVRQTQAEEPFDLLVPVAFTVEGEAQARVVNLALAERTARLPLPEGTRRVDVDPYFDVFRLLDRAEIPPTLGEVFGADRVTLVLPREPGAWGALAEAWKKEGQVEVVGEQDLEALPRDRAVWILGTQNAFQQQLAAHLAPRQAGIADESVRVGAGVYPREGTSFVFTAPHPLNPELAIGWIGCDTEAALPGLARKLPHYGKYSYLAFSGDEPTNVAKGQWEATGSPLIPLAEQPPAPLAARAPTSSTRRRRTSPTPSRTRASCRPDREAAGSRSGRRPVARETSRSSW